MREEVQITKKWMEASSATFRESKNEDGKRNLILETLIVPFGETSRNGVIYNTESIKKTHKMLEGKTLNHNHITTGADVLPRGKWLETWIEDDGMHGKARVFDTKYNESYIEWLEADESPRVSLQISGSAKQFKEKATGKWKREAIISDWLESSTVNLPGFNKAKGSFAVAMAEAFDGEAFDGEETTEALKMKDYVFIKSDGDGFKRGDQGFVKKVIGRNITIQLDKNMKNVVVDRDNVILIPKESTEFFDNLNNIRESEFFRRLSKK